MRSDAGNADAREAELPGLRLRALAFVFECDGVEVTILVISTIEYA